jgi:hypothetical protein
LSELTAARDAVAASIAPPPDAARDTAIAAALEATEPDTAAVIDLRARRRQRAVRVASIAAALLIVAGIIGGLAALSGRNDTSVKSTAAGAASSSSSSHAAPSEGAAASPSLPGNVAADSTATAANRVADLGSFPTEEALADAVRQAQTEVASTGPTASQKATSPSPNFSVENLACASRPDAVFVARAELAGQPVIVIVAGTAGQQTLEVYGLDCKVIFTRAL